MKKILFLILTISFLSISLTSQGQSTIDPEEKLGIWYMYFWNTTIKRSQWGFQGDIQFRNFEVSRDLEQLLLRGGVTFQPRKSKLKFTLGVGHVTSGVLGVIDTLSREVRIYQEALFPHNISGVIYLTHRFRSEQRFVENQDFRTRYRYNLFVNVPFNKKSMDKGTIYLALYNELFLNGEKQISEDRFVSTFDRNRAYAAMGYVFEKNLKVQAGVMVQSTKSKSRTQLQVSAHQKF